MIEPRFLRCPDCKYLLVPGQTHSCPTDPLDWRGINITHPIKIKPLSLAGHLRRWWLDNCWLVLAAVVTTITIYVLLGNGPINWLLRIGQ